MTTNKHLTLKATKREAGAKLSQLRLEDIIPAVCYGKGEEVLQISIQKQDFLKLYTEVGDATIFDLDVNGTIKQVLVQDIQLDPPTHRLIHVDFKIISAGQTITVEVPLEITGVAPAVEDNLGILNQAIQEVEIEVLPKDLPSSIIVDISNLKELSDNILVKDLKLPNGVRVLTEEDVLVVTVSKAKEEVEEEEATEIDFSQIEVEKKGKVEEEEAKEE